MRTPALPVFTVIRRVITTPGGQGGTHRFRDVPFEVHAPNGADAARLASEAKFRREAALGHHTGERGHCC
jgi:hypothetical protein